VIHERCPGWLIASVVGLVLIIGLVVCLVAPHSRIGSLPGNVSPLPCGHAVLTSTHYQGITKAICVRGDVWFYTGGRWLTAPKLEDAVLRR